MSGSEQDFSESSNLGSPQSQGSPYSSPSQQVPHLVNVFSGITCADDVSLHYDGPPKGPYLRMIEQPQNHFRFRYKSEMVGTHGCILGKSAVTSKGRTHPTVELMNYTGKALIRVRLTQSDKDDEHPHKLLEDEQEDRDVSTLVPEQGSYKVGFAGMGIIHTAKKDVPGLLFKKFMEKTRRPPTKDLRAYCENTAKTINLNIVRLRFSAHDIMTDKEICPPVFSDPIHNMKSAATNDLKICRISTYTGKPKGGDDVFILVEKVNKKNILIRFYEQNEFGEIVWSANANFLQSDVHHQYAIVFRTPPYRDTKITQDVKVYLELLRPSDGRTSEPKEFVYKADQAFKQNKRRRVHSSFSSVESCSGNSNKSLNNNVPATVEMINQHDDVAPMYQIHIPEVPLSQPMATNTDDLAEALIMNTGVSYQPSAPLPPGPPHGAPLPDMPPVISLNSAELERLINHDPHLPSEERKKFIEMDWTEYMQSFGESLPDKTNSSMDFLRTSMQLVTDSGKSSPKIKEEPVSPSKSSSAAERNTSAANKGKSSDAYTAYYSVEDGNEVKKLVKEICEIFKNKAVNKKLVVRNKLERLLEMRLSNGDTFLHMTLSSNQPSLEYMIKLIHSVNMTHLLNLTNDLQQTILHLAIIHDLPNVVSYLVKKGCDPMIADIEGNNAVHTAVACQTCLKPLLDAIKQNEVACDLDAYNNERQTALHLAALYDSSSSATLLLSRGAAGGARDGAGRGAAHLAAYDDHTAVLHTLLRLLPESEIDAVDGAGNTVLQIICGKQNICQEKLEIVKLLLEKKADPLKQEDSNVSAWKLSSDKPRLREVLLRHVPAAALEDDVKSEPEDDFESADESESSERGLRELPQYVREVSALLDGGAWRELAARLHVDALCSWYASTASPARTLLTHVRESGDNISSKSLALILQDMGYGEAANIIKRHIE